jgi:hypothetical protein
LFDVYWSAILGFFRHEWKGVEEKMYFIGLVVVLWIVFEDLGFLLVIEVTDKVIKIEFLAPVLAVDEPVIFLMYAVCVALRKRTSSP